MDTHPPGPSHPDFEQLPIARTQGPAMLEGCYRVYSDASNFKRVQANSASNALELSGMSRVVRIERESMYKNTLIEPHFGSVEVTDAAAEGQEAPPSETGGEPVAN